MEPNSGSAPKLSASTIHLKDESRLKKRISRNEATMPNSLELDNHNTVRCLLNIYKCKI